MSNKTFESITKYSNGMENFVTVPTENVRKFQKIEHWRKMG